MSPDPPEYDVLRVARLAPSWIGPHPFGSGFAIGGDNGYAAFTNEAGGQLVDQYPLCPSGESINGIAGFGDYLAASCRDEIGIFRLLLDPNGFVSSAVVPRGSHGVIALPEAGQFLAPLGHDGIMAITPTSENLTTNRINSFPRTPVNFYRLCVLPQYKGKYYYLAACRSAGVGILDYSPKQGETGLTIGRLEADFVDVACLGTPDYPYAMAAVGTKGQLVLSRDIIKRDLTIPLHYEGLAGRIYKVLTGHGHIFLLTGRALYVLGGLAKRLVQAKFDYKAQTPIMTVPMRPVDAAIVDDKWLTVVMPSEIHRYDLSVFDERIEDFRSEESIIQTQEPLDEGWVEERELAEVAAA